MSCCCTNILDKGCAIFCDDLDLTTTTETGAHKIIFESGTKTITFTVTTSGAGAVTLSGYGANLDAGRSYRYRVIDPNGVQITETVSSVTYDCFRVRLDKSLSIP